MHVAQHEALAWTEIDAAITRLAASKGALDHEIGRWLVVAQREGVEHKLGFGSFAEYVERRLGYDARTTFERLRVARALEELPAMAALLRAGQRSWSAVRELTRVATPNNEAAWVEASERMTVRQVESLVAGRARGASPWDPRDPLLTTHRLVFEVPPDQLAEWQEAAEHVRREIGPAATNREVLRAMVHKELGQRSSSQPGYQTAVTLCAGCERTWQRAGGEWVEVAGDVGACARCDTEVVGVVAVEGAPVGDASAHVGGRAAGGAEDAIARAHVGAYADARAESMREGRDGGAHVGGPSAAHAHVATTHVGGPGGARAHVATTTTTDEPRLADLLARLVRRRGSRALTRVLSQVIGAPQTMTPKLRAAARTRDRGRCVVPGCPNFRFVDLHHHRPRSAGGPNTAENVLSLCTRHHRLVHEGVLAIEGSPSAGLVVRHAGGVLYGAAPSP